MDLQHALITLERGSLYHFRDWPNAAVPHVAAGTYTIWRGTQLLYAGMAGRSLTEASIVALRDKGMKRKALYSRLNSHASGQRSGDKFCIYICDRFVVPSLTADDVADLRTGKCNLDRLTRQFIHDELSYRFTTATDTQTAYELERQVQRGALVVGRPLINPL